MYILLVLLYSDAMIFVSILIYVIIAIRNDDISLLEELVRSRIFSGKKEWVGVSVEGFHRLVKQFYVAVHSVRWLA